MDTKTPKWEDLYKSFYYTGCKVDCGSETAKAEKKAGKYNYAIMSKPASMTEEKWKKLSKTISIRFRLNMITMRTSMYISILTRHMKRWSACMRMISTSWIRYWTIFIKAIPMPFGIFRIKRCTILFMTSVIRGQPWITLSRNIILRVWQGGYGAAA